jgi:adenylate kinase
MGVPTVADTGDICRSALVGREDDTPEALAARVLDHHAEAAPVLALFGRTEFVAAFDASEPPLVVQAEFRERVEVPPPG